MISDELKEYIDAQIKETLKSQPVVGVPTDPGLVRVLTEVVIRLQAVIVALQGLPPESGCWERLSKEYIRIRTRLEQAVSAGVVELEDLLDRDEFPWL